MSYLQIYRASAGSGKTHKLTQEFLKLTFENPEKYRRILAVTFTNKAAEEMKSRIVEELDNIIQQGDKSPHFEIIKEIFPKDGVVQIQNKAKVILNSILHDYSRFSVSTIDSFVQRVVRSFSIEMGLQAGYRIEMDTNLVIDDLTEILYKNISHDPDLLRWLVTYAHYKIAEGKNWDFRSEINELANEIFKEKFQEFAHDLARRKNIVKELHHLYQQLIKNKKAFENEMKEYGHQAVEILENRHMNPEMLGNKFKTIINYFKNISSGNKFEPNKTALSALEGIEKWHKKNEKTVIIDQINEVYPQLQELLQKAINCYQENYPNWLTANVTIENFHAFGILNDIHKLLPDYREENNLLLISDTTLILKEIIANNEAPFIYEKVGNRYDHILIDEFQDTSDFQWQNFRPLISNSLSLGAYNLIVGDIKQSIYRWRGGDWKLLLQQIEQDIGQSYIKESPLDTNWRSNENIIRFNNSIFALAPAILQQNYNNQIDEGVPEKSLQALESDGYKTMLQDAYRDSHQEIPKNKERKGGKVEIQFIKVSSRKQMDKAWKEEVTDLLPKKIDGILKSKKYQPGDITILVRTNHDGQKIVDDLLQYQNQETDAFQYDIISADSLFLINSPVVRLLVSAIYFLYDPRNHIHLSNLVYLQHLLNKETTHPHNYFHRKQEEDLTQLLPEPFIENKNLLKRQSLYELIESLVRIFNLNEQHGERPYLRTFQDAIHDFTRNRRSSLEIFLQWWEQNSDRLSLQISDKQNAVQVMTIHKSKGLAFNMVIVPYCNWKLDQKSNSTIWSKTKYAPYNMFPYLPVNYKKDLAQSLYNKDYFDEKLYAYMDALNLLYVAFTRARNELLIFAPVNNSAKKMDYISDLLYQSVLQSKNLPVESGQELINLTHFFNESDMIVEIDSPQQEKISREKETEQEKEFKLKSYPNNDWRNKITINYNSEGFLKESVEYIEDRVNYGKLMHQIMARIKTEADIDEILQEMFFEGKVTFRQRKDVKEIVKKIISRNEINDWFEDKWEKIITEKALLTADGNQKIPDRVLISKDKIIVIDFKFGQKHAQHKKQVHEYMQLLEGMENKAVQGYLYYADNNETVQVN